MPLNDVSKVILNLGRNTFQNYNHLERLSDIMTFNLQVYYLVQRAIKEQKPHYKYSLVPKKLLLVLKRIHGDSAKK